MTPYAEVATFIIVALLLALVLNILPGLMARNRYRAAPAKSESYECGVPPTSAITTRFPVRFYLIAMLFVIFDVEAASFYPWAIQMHSQTFGNPHLDEAASYLSWTAQMRSLHMFFLAEMVIFIVVLAIGYAYVWKRGGFTWR
ncbi:NADH-quinone oxidoreductase subunit A [bacterium]|nr:MAG: NADH-quinone oxidoreductase subunit A [bacterium]